MDSKHRYRSSHDPYNQMEGAEIRPKNIARQNLSDAEKIATSKDSLSSRIKTAREISATSKLKKSEENTTSRNTFRNSVKGVRGAEQNGKKSNKFKKAAPLTLIAGLIFGGGFFFYAAQSMLGPHLSALITKNTDLQFTSYSMRNPRLFKYLMDGDGQVKISNFTKKYRTFSPYLKKRLSSKGIDVGYIDSDGVFKTNQTLSTSKTVLKYNDEIIDANSFSDKFASDANFRDAYYSAKRGRIAGFFDKSASKYYESHGHTRDIFDNFKSTGDTDTDTENFEKTVSDRVTGADTKVNTARHEQDEETGEDKTTKNGDDLDNKNVSGDTPEAKARSFVNGIASKVSSIGVPVCSALRVANIAAVTVSAVQIVKAGAYFLSLMEPVSKAMGGEGDAAAINETLNFLTGQTTTKVDYVDNDGNAISEDVTGSALESANAKLVLGQTRSTDKEIAPYSINNITRAATTIAVSTGVTTSVCSGVMASSAIVSLAANAVPGGSLATIAVGALMQTVGGIVMSVAVGAIVNAIIPYVAKIFASNIFESYTGVPAGNLFFQGAAISNGEVAQNGSAYMPASEERVKEQNRNIVIANANEAELDRLNRSPFDITSTNTFMGSLLSKFAVMAHTNNIALSLTSMSNIIRSSLASLSPAASAADQELMYSSVYKDCDNLEGAVCDMNGLTIGASDYSTNDLAPDDSTYERIITANLEDDGETVRDNSELAKFINFCKNRQSPWGVQDANILNALQTDAGVVVNSMPVIGDVIDVINAAEDEANKAWATGEICLNSADNPRWENEFKYYQRYIQDMRYLSTMDDKANSEAATTADAGETFSNPILAYEAKYEQEHPTDYSLEGTLARISGQTKEDIAFLLEVTKYANYLANYSTEGLFAFHNENFSPKNFHLNTKNISPDAYILANIPNFFTDKRNYIL